MVKTKISIDNDFNDVVKLVNDLNGFLEMAANFERLKNSEKEFSAYTQTRSNFTNTCMDIDDAKNTVRDMINERIISYIYSPKKDGAIKMQDLEAMCEDDDEYI